MLIHLAAALQLAATPPAPASYMTICAKSAAEARELARIRFIALDNDPSAQTDFESGEKARQEIERMRDALDAGTPLPSPYKGAAEYAAASRGNPDPVVSELLMRAARDAFSRTHLTAALRNESWAAGLSVRAKQYAYSSAGALECGLDADNTRWLKAQVATRGWFLKSVDGDRAAGAAWLLVQHADRDPAFQKAMLDLMAPLAATGDVERGAYALLWDRVAVREGRPQRHGTQGRCNGGRWLANPIEDEAQLEARRTAAGLPPMTAYQRRMDTLCPPSSAPTSR
ncbi:DUF6624 domain-containing protein [Caulobacter sp. 73W]|uniref:DUF6624 domain-containing protein n=1 Tax=Caulobacter sp. 73W TaxID=3161137 RepID=A0AB39KSG5_9CAUL